MSQLTENLVKIRNNIEDISKAAGRAQPPTLIAVSKFKSKEAILEVWQAGQRHFGENRVQEAESKFSEFRNSSQEIFLHLIGSLQTNKAADAVALFDVIHTLDRMKLAVVLKKEMERQQRFPRLLIQVNTGNEPQKAGVLPSHTEQFIQDCLAMGLPIKGLMCIPPVHQNPAPHFAYLKNLADQFRLPELSMGMSQDYCVAIQHGATYVRIGTAIFGEREIQK